MYEEVAHHGANLVAVSGESLRTCGVLNDTNGRIDQRDNIAGRNESSGKICSSREAGIDCDLTVFFLEDSLELFFSIVKSRTWKRNRLRGGHIHAIKTIIKHNGKWKIDSSKCTSNRHPDNTLAQQHNLHYRDAECRADNTRYATAEGVTSDWNSPAVIIILRTPVFTPAILAFVFVAFVSIIIQKAVDIFDHGLVEIEL